MYLTIDMGNSATKLVLFEQDELVFARTYKAIGSTELKQLLDQFAPARSILASVVSTPLRITSLLKQQTRFISLNASTALPVINRYETPRTLGKDRLAGVIGAAALFPGKNILVIDAGTCVKYDFINSRKEYMGGSISPGLLMRYKSLHEFTGKLPLIKPGTPGSFIGKNTRDAILTGVEVGIENEISGFIKMYKKRYKSLKLVMTGGDAPRFVRKLNLPIFAAPDLVNIGLKEILKFHDSKE